MNPNLGAVLAAAETLSAEERRELIDLLLVGLDHSPLTHAEETPPALSEAWRQEIARRSASYEADPADTVSWQEVHARWLARRQAGG
jgi:putative addiction module component (TIGR02574 family)